MPYWKLRSRLKVCKACLALIFCTGDTIAGQGGEVVFEGIVTASSCAVVAPPGALWALPATSGSQVLFDRDMYFALNIESCLPHVFDATTINLLGEHDEYNDQVLAVANAPGVGLAIYSRSGVIIPPGHRIPSNAFYRVSEKKVLLSLRARYAESIREVRHSKSNAMIAVEYY